VGLLNVAEGFLLIHRTDRAILEASFPVYDALYANFTAHHLVEAQGVTLPPHAGRGPTAPTIFLRKIFDARTEAKG